MIFRRIKPEYVVVSSTGLCSHACSQAGEMKVNGQTPPWESQPTRLVSCERRVELITNMNTTEYEECKAWASRTTWFEKKIYELVADGVELDEPDLDDLVDD